MDYLILMVILATTLTSFLISYDIACIWSKGFATRVAGYDAALHLPAAISLTFAVPKFHLPVHIRSCWSEFSYNYRNYAARTDGEGIERVWSWLNRIAYSVSMMTAGARWDTLDDFCSFNNWRKNRTLSMQLCHISRTDTHIPLGKELSRKMALAIEMSIVHWRAYRSFSAGLRRAGVDLERWERNIMEWEKDPKKCPSPYEHKEESEYSTIL
jgi:hypothetical protein